MTIVYMTLGGMTLGIFGLVLAVGLGLVYLALTGGPKR